MEHVRYETVPHQPGGRYYRDRTRHYPDRNSAANAQIIDMDIITSVPSRSRRTKPGAQPRKQNRVPRPSHGGDRVIGVSPDADMQSVSGPSTDSAGPSPSQAGHDVDLSDGPDTMSHIRALVPGALDDNVNLYSLSDPGPNEKPGYPYPTLIKLAIHGSPNRRLSLQGIYAALEDRFEWFRLNHNDKAWQVCCNSP